MNLFTKLILCFALLGGIFACNGKANNTNTTNTLETDTLVMESMFNTDTTFFSNEHSFYMATIDPDPENSDTLLLLVKRDTLTIFTTYISKGGFPDYQFIDFNNDSHIDIMLYRGQQMGDLELYLYDPSNNTFVESIGFDRIREPRQLKSNPDYWYSYCRAGCADWNWTSILFTFKNFETVEIGYIYGQGCDNGDDPQNIYIYKVLNNDEENLKLLKTIPYSPFDVDKWNFIEEYWNDNYKKFR